MRSVARLCLVVLLVAGLLDLPALAQNEKPLGEVVQAQVAQLDNSNAVVGTSVYRGDALATDTNGEMRVRLRCTQLYLRAESAATLQENAGVVHATVTRGTVGFSSKCAGDIELEIPEGVLRAADGQPAYGQVTILGPQDAVISAYEGALVLDNDGELHTIAAGTNYRVTMALDRAEQQPTPTSASGDNPIVQPRKRRRRKLAFYLILTGAVAGLSYVIWDHLDESPSTPQ